MRKCKTNMENYLIPKLDFCVTIPYLGCPVTYWPTNGLLQRKYTMTPEVPRCIKKLSAENQSNQWAYYWPSLLVWLLQFHSFNLAERVSTWSREEFQLDRRKNSKLITEGILTWPRNYQLQLCSKNLRHSWKVSYTVIKWCQSSLTPLTGRCDFCIFRYSRFILGLIYSRTADFKGLSRHVGVRSIPVFSPRFARRRIFKVCNFRLQNNAFFKGM